MPPRAGHRSAARSGRPRKMARPRWLPRQQRQACLCEQCEVYKLHLGGGFGRRGIARTGFHRRWPLPKRCPGVPVKLLWSREEDMLHGRFHPVTQAKMTAGLDAAGNLDSAAHAHCRASRFWRAWRRRTCKTAETRWPSRGCTPSGDGAFGYTIPNLLVDHAMRNPAVPAGFLARREPQPECDLSRVLHGRDRPCHRPGPAGAASQTDGQTPQAPGRAECGGRASGLGNTCAAGRVSGPGSAHGLWQLHGCSGRSLGSMQTAS